jgi:hypothetical protein
VALMGLFLNGSSLTAVDDSTDARILRKFHA